MEASKTLRRPSNWQDFESLCKKLWGEIWNCPEIKKNGRSGQMQYGVDVYGIPFGEANYYGIQCKGKDEYTNNQFTEDEITKEIEKAKVFEPPLKKLYFTTTAVKDANIEKFFRKKNIENKANGLFEIHIFSWEDIVDLIDENRQTHDWYIKNRNFKTNKSVTITFQSDVTALIICPKFKRNIYYPKQKDNSDEVAKHNSKAQTRSLWDSLTYFHSPSNIIYETKVILSYSKIQFQIHNKGTSPIEEYKLLFDFSKEINYISKTNIKSNNPLSGIVPIRYVSDVHLNEKALMGEIIPQEKILVSEDTFISEEFFIKPFPRDYEINVKWKLISKDFKDEGELKIIVKPQIIDIPCDVFVDNISNVPIKEGDIEDMVIDKKD